jgi:hypothetical protein
MTVVVQSVPTSGPDAQMGAVMVLAILAHPADIPSRDRFIAALLSIFVRMERTRRHKNPPPNVRSIRDQMTAREARRALDDAFENIRRRQKAHALLMEAQHEPIRRLEHRRTPEEQQRIRFVFLDAQDAMQAATRLRSTYLTHRQEHYKLRPAATMAEVFATFGDNNIRRDIWNPSLPVLPLARWLEVAMACDRVPHERSPDTGRRIPHFYPMVLDPSWLPHCIEFTNRMIEKWPEREGRFPALANVDPSQFIRIVAEKNCADSESRGSQYEF